MLKSSEAYGSSTVGEDRQLSAAIPGDVPSLPEIWLFKEDCTELRPALFLSAS